MEVGNEQTRGLQSGKLFPTKRVCSLVDEILLRGTVYGGLPLPLEESWLQSMSVHRWKSKGS